MLDLINSLKAAAIRTTDFLNSHHDPFLEFERTSLPKYGEALWIKAQRFEKDLTDRFLIRQGTVANYRIPLPIPSPLDLGDQALWHGITLAMYSFKYAVLNAQRAAMPGLPASQEEQDTALRVLALLQGSKAHQYGHGEGSPRLIRGVDEGTRFQDDASNDTLTGHMAGLYYAWQFGPGGGRLLAAQLMDSLATQLRRNDFALTRADGSPTTYGALIQGWKTDPLRLTCCLAVFAAAAKMCSDPIYGQIYERLRVRYAALIPYPKVKLWWIDNHNDNHRAAIHLSMLARIEGDDEKRAPYLQGLERLWAMEHKSGNPWIGYLCEMHTITSDFDHMVFKKVLSEITVEDKQFNIGKNNYGSPFLKMSGGPVLWNGVWMAKQPLPRWASRSQDFFWQRNLYSLDVGSEGAPADSIHNGVDFLVAYWLGRLLQQIKADA